VLDGLGADVVGFASEKPRVDEVRARGLEVAGVASSAGSRADASPQSPVNAQTISSALRVGAS
jgi:hypothetical protein